MTGTSGHCSVLAGGKINDPLTGFCKAIDSTSLKTCVIAETCAHGDENSFLRNRFVRRDNARAVCVQCVFARQVILTPLAGGLALQ